jgi:hypothetical protein
LFINALLAVRLLLTKKSSALEAVAAKEELIANNACDDV